MSGQPRIRDLRLAVRRVLEVMATFPNKEEMQREHPEIEQEDIRQALAYAAANLEDRSVILTAV